MYFQKEGVVLKLKVKTYNKDFEAHKTERQWALKGYVPKADVKGVELWANRNCQNKYVYYSPDEVELATKEQLDTFFKPEREKAKAYRERKKGREGAGTSRDRRKAELLSRTGRKVNKAHKRAIS